jgi:hypothetical protein
MYRSELDSLGDEMLDKPYVIRRLGINNILSDEQFIPAERRGTIRGVYAHSSKLNIWEFDSQDLLLIEVDTTTFGYEHKMAFPEDHQNAVRFISKHERGISFLLEEFREAGRGEDIYSYMSVDHDEDDFYNFRDCNDTLATINPMAIDIPDNGIDENCDGVDSISLSLPVEWTYIEGKELNDDALITWGTEIEVNNDLFLVEKSLNAYTFEEIGMVAGGGNSAIPVDYQFIDRSFTESAYYRVTQIDYDGNSDYSEIVYIKKSSKNASLKLYPNPVKVGEVLIVDTDLQGEFNIQILNTSGKVIKSIFVNNTNLIEIPINELTKGMYLVRITDHQKYNEVVKLMVL